VLLADLDNNEYTIMGLLEWRGVSVRQKGVSSDALFCIFRGEVADPEPACVQRLRRMAGVACELVPELVGVSG
jgi:hypothetical protein